MKFPNDLDPDATDPRWYIRAVASLRLQIGESTIYEGPVIAVPRVGDNVTCDGEALPVEAVVWDFTGAAGDVSVTLVVGTRPYTF